MRRTLKGTIDKKWSNVCYETYEKIAQYNSTLNYVFNNCFYSAMFFFIIVIIYWLYYLTKTHYKEHNKQRRVLMNEQNEFISCRRHQKHNEIVKRNFKIKLWKLWNGILKWNCEMEFWNEFVKWRILKKWMNVCIMYEYKNPSLWKKYTFHLRV